MRSLLRNVTMKIIVKYVEHHLKPFNLQQNVRNAAFGRWHIIYWNVFWCDRKCDRRSG